MVKPVKFAHVVYQTRRFDEMIAWYRNVFEAEVVYENPALAFLTYDNEHHRFAFENIFPRLARVRTTDEVLAALA